MSKKNSQGTITIETMAETSIADIPASLALKAHRQGKTIREARLIERLREFRLNIEAEAGEPITTIETNLGLALADITETLQLKDPKVLRYILGAATYLAVYVDPIPYRPAHPPHHKVRLLLAKLRDTWPGRWGGKVEVEPA